MRNYNIGELILPKQKLIELSQAKVRKISESACLNKNYDKVVEFPDSNAQKTNS
jgi:hypothetical protein